MDTGDEHGRIAWKLIITHIELAAVSPNKDGFRSVMLGRFGRAEVHLTELPTERAASSMPCLWLEVFSRDDGATIDGHGWFDIGDGLSDAVELILEIRRSYPYHS